MPNFIQTNNQGLAPTPWYLADPANIEGNAETAQVLGLTPWMDYEFRVLASNILGTGEPSGPSSRIRTKEAGQGPGCPQGNKAGQRHWLPLQGTSSKQPSQSSNPAHQALGSNRTAEKGHPTEGEGEAAVGEPRSPDGSFPT